AADREALLQDHGALYRPLGEIEAMLFGPADAASLARARSLAHALRETATIGDSLRDGRLPLPMDLLARHRLARGDLAGDSPRQVAALSEWLTDLATALARVQVDGPLAAAALACDRWRARRAGRAAQPLESLRG